MHPTFAAHNKRNKRTTHSKRGGDVFLHLSSSGAFTDFAHGIYCELGGIVRFASRDAFGMRSAPVAVSGRHHALARRVREVISVGSEKQMADIDASGVVSTRTIMADVHPMRDRAYEQDPRDSRCGARASLKSHGCPFAVCAARPEQLTGVWVFSLGSAPFKPLKGCSSWGQVVTGFTAGRTTINSCLAANTAAFVRMCEPPMSSSISCPLARSAPLGIAALGRERSVAPCTVHDGHRETSNINSYLHFTIGAHVTQATS